MKTYHILNGDALKEQFPDSVAGDLLVARECLVDGVVKSASLEELYQVRAKFLFEAYDNPMEEYQNKTVTEFEKIKSIPNGSEINLWFEDDLFCQVNFWFVSYLLNRFTSHCKVYLVRPEVHTSYGFAALNQGELEQVLGNRTPIDQLNKLSELWEFFRDGALEQLENMGKELGTSFPHISTAIQAHVDQIPSNENPGRPMIALQEIMQELATTEFAPVFKKFNQRESIYGFGDLQVKRLFDQLLAGDHKVS